MGADVAIHEVFLTPDTLVKWYGQSPGQALGVGTQVHTSPPAFGKVTSTLKPRHQGASRPPAAGTVPDPMTDFIKAGRWEPAQKAQRALVEGFKKKNNMR